MNPYEQHVRALADARGVILKIERGLIEPRQGVASAFGPMVGIALHSVEDEIDYAVAMHELGHVYSGHLDWMQPPGHHIGRLLDIEAEATSWAYNHARFPLGDAARLHSRSALASYLRGHPDYQVGWPAWTLHPSVNAPAGHLGDPGPLFWDIWARLGGTPGVVDHAVIEDSTRLYSRWYPALAKEAVAA